MRLQMALDNPKVFEAEYFKKNYDCHTNYLFILLYATQTTRQITHKSIRITKLVIPP